MKLRLRHCLNSWSAIVVRPRHADAVCHVGRSWFEPGGSFERRATGCQSSMPGTGSRVFLCDERINIPLLKMRLSEGSSQRRRCNYICIHILLDLLIYPSHIFQRFKSSHLLTFGYSSNVLTSSLYLHFCFYLAQRKPSNSWNTADESWSDFAVCFACSFDCGFDELVRSSAPSFGGVWSKWRSSSHTANHAPQAFCWVCFASACRPQPLTTCFCRGQRPAVSRTTGLKKNCELCNVVRCGERLVRHDVAMVAGGFQPGQMIRLRLGQQVCHL